MLTAAHYRRTVEEWVRIPSLARSLVKFHTADIAWEGLDLYPNAPRCNHCGHHVEMVVTGVFRCQRCLWVYNLQHACVVIVEYNDDICYYRNWNAYEYPTPSDLRMEFDRYGR